MRLTNVATTIVMDGCTVTASNNRGLVFSDVVTCSAPTVLVDGVEVSVWLTRTYRDGRKGFGSVHIATGRGDRRRVVRLDEDDLATWDPRWQSTVRLTRTDVEALQRRCADVLSTRPWTLFIGP